MEQLVMHVLLIGSGGREHALARAISQSPQCTQLSIAPGNPGMADHGTLVSLTTLPQVLEWLTSHHVDLVVIGPEAPLAAGWADALRGQGYAVFGPSQQASRLESSKAFAKQIMQHVHVPTAAFRTFTSTADAIEFIQTSRQPWVVKADGLAAGKGVVVADSVDETIDAVRQLAQMPAGQHLLLEERLYGPEVSLIAMCDGQRAMALPSARDHKRLYDDDMGPNTGGMGAVASLRAIATDTANQLATMIMQPMLDFMRLHDMPFVGALYAGLMLTESGPKVIEFNARFGDPETQVILPLCDGDVLMALHAAACGQLDDYQMPWSKRHAACVVVSSAGYPQTPRTGDAIRIDQSRMPADGYVLQAGTALHDGQLVSNGGRVLNAVGLGDDLTTALRNAYQTVDAISLDGMHYRLDIGQSELL
jgi:phosphoribosylamine--glycine ligase